MSRLFGISTDYLLKDELEHPEKIDGPTPSPQPIPSDEPAPDPRPLRRVSRDLAEEYLDRLHRCAPRQPHAISLQPDCALCWWPWPWRCSCPAAKEYAFLEKEPLEVPPERSWVIWTVAGVLFGAVMTVMRLLNRKK